MDFYFNETKEPIIISEGHPHGLYFQSGSWVNPTPSHRGVGSTTPCARAGLSREDTALGHMGDALPSA